MSFSTSELRARRTRAREKKSVITVGDRAINQLTEVLYQATSTSVLVKVLEYDAASERGQNVPTAFAT